MLPKDHPFLSKEIARPLNEEWAAKRKVSDAVKQLTELLLTSATSIEEANNLAAELEAINTRLLKADRFMGRREWAANSAQGNFYSLGHELNPLMGGSNPLAPPLNFWIEEQRAYGSCELGWQYEGPPGSVHGGHVAAIFDQFLGAAQMISGEHGMTAYLHITYHNRTPLNTELTLEGWVYKDEGNKHILRAEMYADGIKTASCEGLFVKLDGGLQSVKTQTTDKIKVV